ncbi:SRPBCC domain-containing protein [Kineosporia sp. J2-2]|uniref:SRPBCC domain-containing protein n=1 Tax=Kineosporia corallincola TaxID=2835133 RepID=A0ABS5TM74_9ACTN|nr:SRPBCC domain-containing protein [Kineosporia corallincola]MBT0772201.1 SRPBCC domain-containing protein [Kineosporia corallincola]
MSRTDSASLVIAAPPGRAFAALVDRQALESWLPPDGATGRFEHFDLRAGGSYRLVLTFADAPGKTTADSDVVDVRILEVVDGQHVSQAVEFTSDDPAFAGTMLMTWQVSPAPDGGSLIRIRADDVPPGISAEDHAEGLESSLRNLAAYLTR